MIRTKTLLRSLLLSLFIVLLGQPAQAGLVGMQQLAMPSSSIIDTLAMREQIQQQLVELGVAPLQASARVQAMSDAQVSDIAQRLESLPAGADGAGILLTIFIVFVITDVIGATDIFPFIKPVQ